MITASLAVISSRLACLLVYSSASGERMGIGLASKRIGKTRGAVLRADIRPTPSK
jgi:hypothetical protein